MRLILGLGNPGATYAKTRHNAGFWVIEKAAARWAGRLVRSGWAQRASVRQGSELIELAGTLDFMNVTGPPLKGLLREYQLSPDDLILVHDDLDLEPGRLRIKQSGGHGGHNGIRSVIDALGTSEFLRLKIGIGRPAPGQDSAEYVLEAVTDKEMEIIEPCLERAVDALEALIHRGTETAMNQFNVRDRDNGREDSTG
ncbi:MAG TPA: aminoacyl-tRNA hydrolase [Nitrospira sp.]|nr:aminoacyl-tRNA hydrolase [Nitrospira sp.]